MHDCLHALRHGCLCMCAHSDWALRTKPYCHVVWPTRIRTVGHAVVATTPMPPSLPTHITEDVGHTCQAPAAPPLLPPHPIWGPSVRQCPTPRSLGVSGQPCCHPSRTVCIHGMVTCLQQPRMQPAAYTRDPDGTRNGHSYSSYGRGGCHSGAISVPHTRLERNSRSKYFEPCLYANIEPTLRATLASTRSITYSSYMWLRISQCSTRAPGVIVGRFD
jgi:hypothetical protein